MSKVLIIGLDGAEWDLLNLLIKEGVMPNIQKLKDGGVHGVLKSTIPPVTAPAWASFSTGKNPGKHGCFDFIKLESTLTDIKIVNRSDIKGKTFYEILDERGFKCICINLPLSWPPRIKNGIITASITTKGNRKIFPERLLYKFPVLQGYRITPNFSLVKRGKLAEYVEDIRRLEKIRFECAKVLFRTIDWDLFFVLFSGTDFIQHHLYDKLINSKNEHGAIELYRDIDSYIGWFKRNSPSKTNVFIVSDHGFTTYHGIFYVNEWLMRENYLDVCPRKIRKNTNYEVVKSINRTGTRKKVRTKITSLVFRCLIKLKFSARLYGLIKKLKPLDTDFTFEPMLENTIAYCPTYESWGIYINSRKKFSNGIVDEKEYKMIRSEIILKLRSLKDPKTGDPLFKAVLGKEEIYKGPYLRQAPDIIFIPNNYYYYTHIRMGMHLPLTTNLIHNYHAPDEIFIAYGPDIKEGKKIHRIRIYDIAPTILHMFNVPIPSDMDGKVLKEVFRKDSKFNKREVRYKQRDERNGIREKIRELRKKNNIIS